MAGKKYWDVMYALHPSTYAWAVGSRLGGDLSLVVGGVPEGRVEGGGYGPGPDSGAGVGGVGR